jgi:hypothetical protein
LGGRGAHRTFTSLAHRCDAGAAPPVFTTGIEWPRSRIKCGTNFWSSSHSTSCNNSSSTQAAFTSLLPGPAPICCCPVPALLAIASARSKNRKRGASATQRPQTALLVLITALAPARVPTEWGGVGWRGRRSVENGSFFVCLFATEQNFPHGGSTRHFRIARFWNTEAHTHTNK